MNKYIGRIASCMSILMYVSYIDQIQMNISGNPGSIILPICTVLNCIFWIIYGYTKDKKDYPIIICNIPGVVLGLVTILTAL